MSKQIGFPEGAAVKEQVAGRHKRGTYWRWVFQASTIVGILALTALLYNILNESFGFVAVQNQVDPEDMVQAMVEESVLALDATTSSENDAEIAAGIAGNPNAIGFLGHGQYVANEADLKVLSVNGVAPSAATVADGSYPLARPLYLYTSNQIMQTNQAASVFVNYYLTHVSSQIEKVGYFPAAAADLGRAQRNWISSNNLELAPGQWGTLDPEGIGGRIVVVGSSTVAPLTTRMAGLMGGSGYVGKVQLATDGTTAGFAAFCAGEADIVNASRPIRAEELKACRGNGRFPVEMQIGTDALAVVVSKDHSYLSDVSTAQLEQIFSSATSWSDVNASWGSDSIARFIPGVNSGTLDVFTAQVFNTDLQALPKEELVGLLEANISTGLGRRFEREQRFYADSLVFEDEALFAEVCASDEPPAACALEARSQENVYSLIVERIVSPDVVNTWSLIDSIFNRSSIEEQMLADYPGATLEFRSWLTGEFIVSPQSSTPELAGVRTAIFGSLWVVFITIVFSFPVGVGAAIYLEEYATDNALNRLIQTNINNLAGVPSIIYGMLGLAIFVRALEGFTSGASIGAIEDPTTANGRTIISAGLTLGLLILPLIIINAQEAIRAVPSSLRQAGFALGATKWQTIWHHVLPNGMPGILTGTILAISRAIGETAPLVVVGASTFITIDPNGPFSKFTTLPIQIYQWTSRPQAEFRNIAAAAIIVLLVMLLTLNASAVFMRNRYAKKMA